MFGKPVDQTTARRPGIMFLICMCTRFQFAPKESHFNAAKRILKYLHGMKEVTLWYPCHVSLNLIGYSDSDFAG